MAAELMRVPTTQEIELHARAHKATVRCLAEWSHFLVLRWKFQSRALMNFGSVATGACAGLMTTACTAFGFPRSSNERLNTSLSASGSRIVGPRGLESQSPC